MPDDQLSLEKQQTHTVFRYLLEDILNRVSVRPAAEYKSGIDPEAVLDEEVRKEFLAKIEAVTTLLGGLLVIASDAYQEVVGALDQLKAELLQPKLKLAELENSLSARISEPWKSTPYIETLVRKIENAIASAANDHPTFSILLFSDTHFGCAINSKHPSPFPSDADVASEAAKRVINDLDELEAAIGISSNGWDVIAFAGDIVHDPANEERFREVTRFREPLFDRWKAAQFDSPHLVATIGNHDLKQFNQASDKSDLKSAQKFRKHSKSKDRKFEDLPQDILAAAVEKYKAWWKSIVDSQIVPKRRVWCDDGSYIVQIQGLHYHLGIFSLNSVYDCLCSKQQHVEVQSTIHLEQFQHLICKANAEAGLNDHSLLREGETFQEWQEKNDLNILLTHLGYDDLTSKGQDNLLQIYDEAQIHLHLSGHLRSENWESTSKNLSRQTTPSDREIVCWKNYSLFGRPQWRPSQSTRPYGYTALDIKIVDDELTGHCAKVRICPRFASPDLDFEFVAATSHHRTLENGQFIEKKIGPLKPVKIEAQLIESENFKFDVAVSYAGKDQKQIKPILAALKQEFGVERVFDYREEIHSSRLDNLQTQLSQIFSKTARWVVAFHSKNYLQETEDSGGNYCRWESEAIRNRFFKESSSLHGSGRIIRLDNTSMPGFESIAAVQHYDLNGNDTIESIAKDLPVLIRAKLNRK